MCNNLTYRSDGAEMSVRTVAINILLRWSKEGFHFIRYTLIGKNGELFFISTHVSKIVQTLVVLT